MKSKPASKVKHIPQRTCVGCRTVLPKRTLIRLVRTADGVHVDPSGKASGRGAYLHDRRSCWDKALKGALAQALKIELSAVDRERLETISQSYPADVLDRVEETAM